MNTITNEPYVVYKKIIEKVMLDPESLPSLPAMTLELRSACSNQNSTSKDISSICAADPAFSALLMASASSAHYVQAAPPKTLESAVTLLGRGKVDSLVMAYSVKSLFVFRSPDLKQLYQVLWQRMILKAGISAYIASRTSTLEAEEALLSALLTEVGTLATLSAFADIENKPKKADFFKLCREYAKIFGAVLLKKWQVSESFVECLKACGRWNYNAQTQLELIDVVNLGLYCAIKQLNPGNVLPPIEELPSFQKLPIEIKQIDHLGSLQLVSANPDAVSEFIGILG